MTLVHKYSIGDIIGGYKIIGYDHLYVAKCMLCNKIRKGQPSYLEKQRCMCTYKKSKFDRMGEIINNRKIISQELVYRKGVGYTKYYVECNICGNKSSGSYQYIKEKGCMVCYKHNRKKIHVGDIIYGQQLYHINLKRYYYKCMSCSKINIYGGVPNFICQCKREKKINIKSFIK